MINKIRKYANFLLEGCLKLTKDDKLFIIGNTLINDFLEIVKDEANKIGIKNIEVLNINLETQKEAYKELSYEEIIKSPFFDKTKYNKMAREGYAFLNIYSPVPGYFDGINEELIGKVSSYQLSTIEEYRDYQNKSLIKWNISSVPNQYWAQSLDNITLDQLWELIFDICLINDDNPSKSWDLKINKLKSRAKYLNELEIAKLIYQNSKGTNLEIGLPENYIFASADGLNIVNMPTEEVFTSPHKMQVNGIVYSSKPLIHNENVIDEFYLEFKNGKIINYDAKIGYETLKGIIDTDEGSKYLGEVALVDYDSPISNTKVIFNNTLYDENASCHLAIGAGFQECIKDGLTKTKEELIEMGVNYSHEHVDFFIGTSDLFIKAILKNGEEVVIMENGNFVRCE